MEGFWHGEDCGRCGRAEWRLWDGGLGLGMDFGIFDLGSWFYYLCNAG